MNCRTGPCGGLQKWKEADDCTSTNSCKAEKENDEEPPGKVQIDSSDEEWSLDTNDQINGFSLARPSRKGSKKEKMPEKSPLKTKPIQEQEVVEEEEYLK